MILIDTHIWIWWASELPDLKPRHRELLEAHRSGGLGVSAISIWEISKKYQLGKLGLDRPFDDWLKAALALPDLRLLELNQDILVESTRLPDGFRSAPADEIIVATSRVLNVPLLTADEKLLNYEHFTKLT